MGLTGCLSDRVSQTVNGVTTNYVLDQVAPLTQVLSDGTNAYLYGNGRIGEEQPGGWQYHLGDALGSVRQLVDADASVTLSRAYEPFGDPLVTTGMGSSIYGFTGEQRDGTGLVYLRARYYAATQGRFLTRDAWEGDPNQPMSYNAWLYVHANPANFTDPMGLYGPEAHRDLTLGLVVQSGWLSLAGSSVDVGKLAAVIASGNLRVDSLEALGVLDSFAGCQICHFSTLGLAHLNLDEAIALRNPYLFGAALHQLQDYYSHGREGYGPPYGHFYDDLRGGKGPLSRPIDLISDFYAGGHAYRSPGGSIAWWPSPYPAHPEADVVADVRQRNPGINIGQLSLNDLIDVYLRRDPTDPLRDLRVEERGYFGLDTDFYVPNSSREFAMTADSARAVSDFLRAVRDGCNIDWRTPSDAEVQALLME